MGGGLLRDTEKDYPSRFEPGGGTFRGPYEPKLEHPLLTQTDETMFNKFRIDQGDHQKVYDMEALKRLVELLNKDREKKPHGVPDNASIGF